MIFQCNMGGHAGDIEYGPSFTSLFHTLGYKLKEGEESWLSYVDQDMHKPTWDRNKTALWLTPMILRMNIRAYITPNLFLNVPPTCRNLQGWPQGSSAEC